MHVKDTSLLEKFRDFLGGIGYISKEGANAIRYRIHSIKDLSILISHLDNYPLITQKLQDYLIFFALPLPHGAGGGRYKFFL